MAVSRACYSEKQDIFNCTISAVIPQIGVV